MGGFFVDNFHNTAIIITLFLENGSIVASEL